MPKPSLWKRLKSCFACGSDAQEQAQAAGAGVQAAAPVMAQVAAAPQVSGQAVAQSAAGGGGQARVERPLSAPTAPREPLNPAKKITKRYSFGDRTELMKQSEAASEHVKRPAWHQSLASSSARVPVASAVGDTSRVSIVSPRPKDEAEATPRVVAKWVGALATPREPLPGEVRRDSVAEVAEIGAGAELPPVFAAPANIGVPVLGLSSLTAAAAAAPGLSGDDREKARERARKLFKEFDIPSARSSASVPVAAPAVPVSASLNPPLAAQPAGDGKEKARELLRQQIAEKAARGATSPEWDVNQQAQTLHPPGARRIL